MNRRDRRRARSLKEFIASGDGDRKGSPEFEAEVERDSKLALELEQRIRMTALLPWLARHPEVDWTCTAPALFRVAAIEIMAACPGTTPNDVGTMAAEVAKSALPIANEVSKRAETILGPDAPPAVKKALDDLAASMKVGPPPDSDESFVQKQVRLVLEQQTRDIADKLKTWCPAGVGFLLFLADYGAKGNLAYVSTCCREDAIKLVEEWLGRQPSGGP